MMLRVQEQLKIILLSLALLVLQFGVFNYLPFLRLINLALLATVSFSYFGDDRLSYVLALLLLGGALDTWGASLQWGFFSLTLLFVFLLDYYLKGVFLRKENLFSFLILFSLAYFVLILGYQIQYYLVLEQQFFQADYYNYLRAYLVNLPFAVIFYYGNRFSFFTPKQNI